METKYYVAEQRWGIPASWKEVARWPFEDGLDKPTRFVKDAAGYGYPTRLTIVTVEIILTSTAT